MGDVEFWRMATVIEKVGLSKSEIYKRISVGNFPSPRRYPGSTRTFWLSTEVCDWQQQILATAEEG